MKILHVTQGYTPSLGGTERLIQKLSETLIRNYGDDVTVFTTTAARNCEIFWREDQPALPAGVEVINGVTVRRFDVFNRWSHLRFQLMHMAEKWQWPYLDHFRAFVNGPIVFGMTRAIAKHPAEAVAASSFPFLHMYYALRGAHLSHKPMILHGALHPTDPWNFDRPMIYNAIKASEAYIANSRYERDYLLDHDIPADKIHVIGVGVDIADFAHADGAAVRSAHGWGDSPVIGFIGQLTERKGVDQLLQAMPHVWLTNPTVKLLLAGASTSYLDGITAQAEALPIPNQVVIKPDFSEAEKANLFAACDVIVFPSMEESFGIVFLEAWASHKPVIGLRRGAIPTVVNDTVDGLLVEARQPEQLAQAILTLLLNPDRRRKMGEAGLGKVKQHYTWDIVTAKFRAVYQAQTLKYRQKQG